MSAHVSVDIGATANVPSEVILVGYGKDGH
jgi:hypothetical protein